MEEYFETAPTPTTPKHDARRHPRNTSVQKITSSFSFMYKKSMTINPASIISLDGNAVKSPPAQIVHHSFCKCKKVIKYLTFAHVMKEMIFTINYHNITTRISQYL